MVHIMEIRSFGGLGNIGGNMIEFTIQKSRFIIDCGILFPNNDCFGINYIIPNLSTIREPENLVITHGHEDHIGAITHFVEKFPTVQIWAPPFASMLIKSKLKGRNLKAKINTYIDNQKIEMEDITLHPIRVEHSIPDTFAILAVNKKLDLSILYASDFRRFDIKSFPKKLIDKITYRLMLPDSTNILSTNKSNTEDDVKKSVEGIFKSIKGRIFATMFASNIDRIETFIEVAIKNKRKIALIGASVNSYVDGAIELKLLPANLKFVDRASIDQDDENILIILSGCQGDFKSALRRVAYGDDKSLMPRSTDTFIFSSKTIPGNEKQVDNIKNAISKCGCTILDDTSGVHASGHPDIKDLKELYAAYRPTDVIPVHGETLFLNSHAKFIKGFYPNTNVHILYNNSTFTLDSKFNSTITHDDEYKMVAIHGNGITLEKETLSERRKCASNGVVFISNFPKNKRYSTVGIPKLSEETCAMIDDAINRCCNDSEELKISVRRILNGHLGYKPTVVIHT